MRAQANFFGDIMNFAADENTPFRLRNPYAVAKFTAYRQLANYREANQLFVCTGMLFNHESPLCKENFVTKKIIPTTCRIYEGSQEKLYFGNTDIYRDWGWAPTFATPCGQ